MMRLAMVKDNQEMCVFWAQYEQYIQWSRSNSTMHGRGSLGFGEEALQSLPGNIGSQVLLFAEMQYSFLLVEKHFQIR